MQSLQNDIPFDYVKFLAGIVVVGVQLFSTFVIAVLKKADRDQMDSIKLLFEKVEKLNICVAEIHGKCKSNHPE